MMEKVSGIGGVFFRATRPVGLADWYESNLGGGAGITVNVTEETFPNGRFAHLDDPEGNRIELWEPAGEDLTPQG